MSKPPRDDPIRIRTKSCVVIHIPARPSVLEVLPDGDAQQFALTVDEVREALRIGAEERRRAEGKLSVDIVNKK
jgi:hypothetical protein